MTSILKADEIQDSSGNLIIKEVANAITIGASGDTITIPSGATITNSGTATGFGGGKILQVVSGAETSQQSTTSTSFVDLSSSTNVSMTCSATSSKVLILANFNECYFNGTHCMSLEVTAAGSQIMEIECALYTPSSTGERLYNQNAMLLYSPSSTSAIEYKLRFKSSNGTEVRVCQNGSPGGSTLTLMEVDGS